MKIKQGILIGVLGIIFSCSSDFEQREVAYYEDSEKLDEIDAETIKSLFSNFGFSSISQEIKYDISVYKFYYRTEYEGQEIIASGLLSMPMTSDKIPIASVHNGTIVANADAPSEDWGEYITLMYFSAAGYIMIMPDYIGFGSSSDLLHPYYIEEYYGSSITDMIKAAEEFAYIERARFDGNLFLAGYSEGGYATMAVHKAIEENPLDGMQIVASAPASGGYDVKSFQEYFFGLETYSQPFFMGFVAASYNEHYFQTSTLSDYLREPYASALPGLYDGSMNGSAINSQLTTTVADLLQPDLLVNFETDPNYSEFLDAIQENSLINWAPIAPMYLYHGTSDITVPYENSVTTYENLLASGANAENLQLIDLEGKTHNSGALPYFLDVFLRFNALK